MSLAIDHNASDYKKTKLMLCCLCGLSIEYNPSNMCVSCIRNNVDITEDINKKLVIHSCRHCGRFLGPPWQSVQLESKELLAMCLRKINGLNKVKLIDAVWIWTEPHSLRLKIKLTVQKEIANGAILQQATIIEFAIKNQQCKECEQNFAQGAWHAIVQVRQRVSHKRTFFYLEQLILKHDSHMECVKIVTFKDGMDFYFGDKNQALRFVEFLGTNVPTKSKYSRKLISANLNDNTANFKHNFLVEIAPVCKDDLIVLPKALAQNVSNISRLVLVKRISAGIHVIDPLTGQRAEVSSEKYWRSGFKALLTCRQLVRFIVLSVEPLLSPHHSKTTTTHSQRSRQHKNKRHKKQVDDHNDAESVQTSTTANKGNGLLDPKARLAECIVARERDFGTNDTQFTCITHLGNLLREGDVVQGYDFTCVNWNLDEDTEKLMQKSCPDLILVRKCYDTKESKQGRKWRLRKLRLDALETASVGTADTREGDADYEEFLREIETDKEMRAHINLYKKPNKNRPSTGTSVSNVENKGKRSLSMGSSHISEEEYDDEEVRLDELLDEMTLSMNNTASDNNKMPATIPEEDERWTEPPIILNGEDAARIPVYNLEVSPPPPPTPTQPDFT